MKKRNFRLFSFAILFALGVSSCGIIPSGGGGGDSDLEKKQKEIYELYRAVGGEMTYEQWLNSIRGENGSMILFGEGLPSTNIGKVGDGYLNTSTWDVYFRTTSGWQKMGNIMGRQGEPGKDGVTPHIGENGNWWIGSTDTGIKAEGKDGQAGKDGSSPYIGENGNWWIGTTDTGIKAEGKDGQAGKDGVSIVSIVKTGQKDNVDEYTITYSDGHTSTFSVTNGVDGEQGIQGDPGKDGHTPIITILDGYWVVDGVSTGIRAEGKDGLTPYIGENGNWFIGSTDTGVKAQGAQGNPGETPRIGENGNWWIGNVDTGVKAQGPQGQSGKDGVSVVSIIKSEQKDNVDTYTITYSDGNISTFTVTNGVDGEQGIQGEPGKDGHTPLITINEQGFWEVDGVSTGILAQGQSGKDGLTPYVGENGNWWIGDVDTNYKATGAQGEPGHTPEIKIVAGYWVIDGVSTGVKAEGKDGEAGHTPVITIIEGYWVIDGVSTGIKVTGEQGEPGKTAWSNTILPASNGYITVDVGSALEGEMVTFYAHADYGYTLSELYLNGVNYTEYFDYVTNSITVPMVKNGYVVRATFEYSQYDVMFFGYDDKPISHTIVSGGMTIYSDNYVNLDDPRLQKPSTDIYDYVLVGWSTYRQTYNIIFKENVNEDMLFYPVYEAIEKVDTKTKYGVDHEGTLDDPFTNEDAIKVTKAIDADPSSTDRNKTFYIKGVVDRFYNAPGNRSDETVSFYLTPSVEGGEQFEVYGARSINGEYYTFKTLYPGVEVVVSGTLVMYGKQPETNRAFIEFINYIQEPPVMNTHSVSVSEAIAVANSLKDGDTTYDLYAVTGYVVKMSKSSRATRFYLSDSLDDLENVYAVEPYLPIESDIAEEFFGYGAKITLTDHIRNYHNVPSINNYYVDRSMLTLIESGTDEWPGMPTGITFYDMNDNPISDVVMQVGETIKVKYVLEGNEPLDSYLYFSSSDNAVSVKKTGEGVISLTCRRLIEDSSVVIRAYNSLEKTIGLLFVQSDVPYIAPEYLELNYDLVQTKVFVEDVSFINQSTVIAYPEGCTVKGYSLSSSNDSVAEVYNDQILFVGEGEVDIFITEIGSGVSTTVHFTVTKPIEEVINFLHSIAEKFEGIEFNYQCSAQYGYTMFANEEVEFSSSAYDKICLEYGAHDECEFTISDNNNSEIVKSSIFTVGEYSYATCFVIANFGDVTLSSFGIVYLNANYDNATLLTPFEPTFEVGSSFVLLPVFSADSYASIQYFVNMSSSDTNVAVVGAHSNVVNIVGDGECTISCTLFDGTVITYTFVTPGYYRLWPKEVIEEFTESNFWSNQCIPGIEADYYVFNADYGRVTCYGVAVSEEAPDAGYGALLEEAGFTLMGERQEEGMSYWTANSEEGFLGAYGIAYWVEGDVLNIQYTNAWLPVSEEFPLEAIASFYSELGIEGIEIPEYSIAAEGSFFEIDDRYLSNGALVVYTNGSTFDERIAYEEALVAGGWSLVSSVLEEEVYSAQYQLGETGAFIEVIDYSAEGYIILAFEYKAPLLKDFPASEVAAFFEENGVIIPEENIGVYDVASEDGGFEADDSYEGYFDVYVYESSAEEMNAYKDQLVDLGWTVVGESEGDYELQYGETAAYVDIINYGDYMCVSFFVKTDVPPEPVPVEGMTPEEIASGMAVYFGVEAYEHEDYEGVWEFYNCYELSEGNTVEGICAYVDSIFEEIYSEFTLEGGEWGVDDYGESMCRYVSESGVACEIYVYEDIVYVDAEGNIVDEGTEGATPVNVAAIEFYSYYDQQ